MPSTLLLLGLLCVCAPENIGPSLHTHVRPLTPLAVDLLPTAAARSATVTRLLDQLETSDVIVYVKVGLSRPGVTVRACLTLVNATGRLRYLLIWIDVLQNSPDDRIVWLAHELRHAIEIASVSWVRDEASLLRLYESSGRSSDEKGHFETQAAVEAAALARAEIALFPYNERGRAHVVK